MLPGEQSEVFFVELNTLETVTVASIAADLMHWAMSEPIKTHIFNTPSLISVSIVRNTPSA